MQKTRQTSKYGLFTALSFFFGGLSFGQLGTFNPYSQLGVGLPVANPVVALASMGGGYNGIRTNNFINFYNAASYSAYDNVQLQFGFETQFLTGRRNDQFRRANLAFFNQIALGIPILKERIGMTFGYQPFTNVGYKFGTTDQIIAEPDTVDIRYTYEGRGGTDRVFLGFGGRPVKGLSIGFNAYMYIGNIESLKTSYFPAGFGSSNVQKIIGLRIADFGMDFGAQYEVPIKQKYRLTLGATYALGKEMAARRTGFTRYFTGELFDQFYAQDTLFQRQKVKLRLPSSFGGGMSFGVPGFWMVNADFSMNRWSEFRYPQETPEILFGDNWRVSAGAEITPDAKNQKNILNRVSYRLGARYGNSFLRAGGEPFKEIGISFGFGIPILSNALIERKLLSNLNIGIEYVNSLPPSPAFTREQMFRLVFSFNLKDNWFRTYKFK